MASETNGLCWLRVDDLLGHPAFPTREEEPASEFLLSSIRLHGVLCPLLVRPVGGEDGQHQVVCGYRRLLAAREAGLDEVPVMVSELEDPEAIRCFLSENTCRRELSGLARTAALDLLKSIREGEPSLADEGARAGSRVAATTSGEAATRTGPVASEVDRGAVRWREELAATVRDPELDLEVDEEAATAEEGWSDLLERVEELFGSVRQTRRIEMGTAVEIVEDLLRRTTRRGPLAADDVYCGPARDGWLAQHSLLSASLMSIMVPADGLFGLEVERSYALAGLVHDVGMVFLDPARFHAPRRLETGERKEVQCHTRLGHAILLGAGKEYAETALVALSHHERIDGSGYPNGQRGGELGRLVRAMSLVDAFASMTGQRPYRRSMEPELALERLAQETERGQFDPTLYPVLHRSGLPATTAAASDLGTTGIPDRLSTLREVAPEHRNAPALADFY